MKIYNIPTGFLFTQEYSKGQLETLSIGDYGKAKNIKADFLGFHNDINGVPNGPCMSISEKWVITLSTQYGCSQKCIFCDCPKIKFRGNASFNDLKQQLYSALRLFPNNYTDRLNIHFARMGEPIYNRDVFKFSRWLASNKQQFQHNTGIRVEVIHPVLTTSLPNKHSRLEEYIMDWCDIKNYSFNGQAGLQFSINSTDNGQRNHMFANRTISLEELSDIADRMPTPLSRKYCLNFALASTNIVDGKRLAGLFDSSKFMCKITPIHNNNACRENGIETLNGYKSFTPYKAVEEDLKANGFDVIVFIPSMDEENGLVTCGNSILGGGKLQI